MKWIIAGLIVVLGILFLLPTPEPKTSSSESVTYTNLTYFDGESWHENTSFTVTKGRIAQNEDTSGTTVDMQGKFIIPGLIDAHTHTWGDALKQAMRFGVTTELDMFTDVQFLKQHKKRRESLAFTDQADIFSAGTLITSEGGHGSQYVIRIPTIENAQQAQAFIQDRVDEGSDFIKIVYNRKPDYGPFTTIDYDTMVATIQAAHSMGKLAVVHVSNRESALDVVNAGADGLVHTFGDKIASEALLQAMHDNQVFIIPTLSVIASMSNAEVNQKLLDSPYLADKLSSAERAALEQKMNASFVRPNYFENAMTNTKLMYEKGITILAGTDAPNPGTAHGVSMHGELLLLVESGMSIDDAIRAATINANKTFTIGERGHLKQGARADFVVLAKDPRINISHSQTFDQIYKNGILIENDPKTLNGPIELSNQGKISDFQENLDLMNGVEIIATSDQMMGGNSDAQIQWQAQGCDTPGSLVAQGKINNAFAVPWAGAYLSLTDNYQQGINLSNYKSLVFNSFGSDGTYRIMFFMPESSRPYVVNFDVNSDCTETRVLFAEHPQMDWGNVAAIGWVASQGMSNFKLALDDIVIEN